MGHQIASLLRLTALSVAVAATVALATGPAQAGFFDSMKGVIGGMASPGSPSSALGDADLAAGLREALRVGSERVVDQLGKPGGFDADPDIHIPLPGTLQKAQSLLRAAGMAGLADDLETRLNRAAEAAVPEAKAVFVDAIAQMTLDDVQRIYSGPDDAATQYFKEKMTPTLTTRMTPIVNEGLAEAGAVKAYDDMMGSYRQLPFVPDVTADLSSYVVSKTLDGTFHYLAIEEGKIRNDPLARSTELLKKVFGGN